MDYPKCGNNACFGGMFFDVFNGFVLNKACVLNAANSASYGVVNGCGAVAVDRNLGIILVCHIHCFGKLVLFDYRVTGFANEGIHGSASVKFYEFSAFSY